VVGTPKPEEPKAMVAGSDGEGSRGGAVCRYATMLLGLYRVYLPVVLRNE
jgi:hypothetical protein